MYEFMNSRYNSNTTIYPTQCHTMRSDDEFISKVYIISQDMFNEYKRSWYLVSSSIVCHVMSSMMSTYIFLESWMFVHHVQWVDRRIKLEEEKKQNKHNAEMQRTDPGTKVIGEFSIRDRISHIMHTILIIPIVLFGKKRTKLIYHMTWLYH